MTNTYSVGFIGGGNMANSIIGGLIPDILPNNAVHVFDPNEEQLQQLAAQYGICPCKNNAELVNNSDVIILAVKPQVMNAVLTPIQNDLKNKQPLIISIAAGITCQAIETLSDNHAAVIRVMPNTPALVQAGASGLYANQHVSTEQKNIAQTLMNAVGSAFWVDNEADIDAVTALSGSGPAYFMLFVQSLIDAGEKAGLPKDIAKQLAIDTCAGSAKLMSTSDLPIQQLIDNVTSPRGTTEQALLSFKKNQLSHTVAEAFDAALKRSKELGKELS
jgi:pyrroline-5-carboxylate reductase